MPKSSIDRSRIRVKAMIIVVHEDGTRHLVSSNAPTDENPHGFHRLIGGSVELGESLQEAIIREVDEELGARIHDLRHLGVVENIFHYNGELGHELVALYKGRLDPTPADKGATLTESDGSVVPVVWRSLDDVDVHVPLYPVAVRPWIDSLGRHSRNNR
ncbi:NUDIX hydrolase [Microbacterium esteraromaticum]|uniref:NUDIX hydrolase n=1 Tax=Microbacterium esteraromaticum TaxID=57043 RepID=UPI0015F627B4|nr:NUDIX domain-containing protein [Microbacterium esteraromaticum]